MAKLYQLTLIYTVAVRNILKRNFTERIPNVREYPRSSMLILIKFFDLRSINRIYVNSLFISSLIISRWVLNEIKTGVKEVNI